MKTIKKVLVIGATGGSGRSTVKALVKSGYQVTAMSRQASLEFKRPVLTIDGSVLDSVTLKSAIEGQDAVIVTLGISENPFRVRLKGPQHTPMNIRSAGTRNIIELMKEHKINRLIVQTSYGSGPSKDLLRLRDKLLFNLLLKPQIADTDTQDRYVRESGLNWTIVQPVHLSSEPKANNKLFASPELVVSKWSISRELVGEFNATSLFDSSTYNQTMALSSI